MSGIQIPWLGYSLMVIGVLLLIIPGWPLVRRIFPITANLHLGHREPLKLIDSFPKDNQPIIVDDLKRVFLKFNKPIDRESEGLIGNLYVRANTWCQWNIGGWIEYAENDTKLIWHINGEPQNNNYFQPKEAPDYPVFEIQIPHETKQPGLRATDGSRLPRTIIRVKVKPTPAAEINITKHTVRKIVKQGYFPIDVEFTLTVPHLPIQLANVQLCIADEMIDPVSIIPAIPRTLEANLESYAVKFEPTYNQFLKGRITSLTREEELKLMAGSSIRKAVEYKAHLLLHIGGEDIESQEFMFDSESYRSQ